jgi:hypothetical protein
MATGGRLVAVLCGGLLAASALSGSVEAAAGQLNLAPSAAITLRSNGRGGRVIALAMGRAVAATGRSGKAAASIVCACANACAKSGTAWNLRHGSAIGWEPGCTKFASGCGMSAGVIGAKTNSPFL